jgi:aspartokinase/homoserine dehydrogenase 1
LGNIEALMAYTLTMKFGGTSVGDENAIRQVIEIVANNHRPPARRTVVVVSALSGTTDRLLDGAKAAGAGQPDLAAEVVEILRSAHQPIIGALAGDEAAALTGEIGALLDRYTAACNAIRAAGATPQLLDEAAGIGERMSARLVAAALRHAGVRATALDSDAFIVTDDRHQHAAPLMKPTRAKLRRALGPVLNRGEVPVVTGFIGATEAGVPTTLGRGGSDYSASIVGACLETDEVWIWTDVDGVMSADPRRVADAHSIPFISYGEVAELAYFGAKVLHPRCIRPVVERRIPLRVKNTFNPSHPGTLIGPDGHRNGGLKAVSAIPHVSLITVEGNGMLGVPGIAARTFGAVAKTGTNVLLISQASSEQSICFTVPQSQAAVAAEALKDEFHAEIERRDIDRVSVKEGATIVTLVGEGMLSRPGIAGAIFSATGDAGINVIAIAQGSSDCGISLVVDGAQGDEAVRAIHAAALERSAPVKSEVPLEVHVDEG